jgi:hypothetical protein
MSSCVVSGLVFEYSLSFSKAKSGFNVGKEKKFVNKKERISICVANSGRYIFRFMVLPGPKLSLSRKTTTTALSSAIVR